MLKALYDFTVWNTSPSVWGVWQKSGIKYEWFFFETLIKMIDKLGHYFD